MQFELFGDRYQLQDQIGRGGMSTVYRALDMQTDRIVAIKVLRGTSSIIAHDVALGLGHAHQRGFVHCDVKPQNIVISRDWSSIKLADFVIVMYPTTAGMTLISSPYYAPEQSQGEMITPAADVYALGVVMYEMLTGRTPFNADSSIAMTLLHIHDQPVPPRQLNPTIPPALEKIIPRCLEKVPEMRFRDSARLARALETLAAN